MTEEYTIIVRAPNDPDVFVVESPKESETYVVSGIPQGVPGIDAYQVALNNGFVGSVDDWIDSLKGDSAYDVALDNGFIGTEAEWLESLKTGLAIDSSVSGYILSNDGNTSIWVSLQDKLNTEQINWDLGEI